MVEEVLITYIRRRLKSGDSMETIKDDLTKAGYSDSAIQEAFENVKDGTTIETKELRINPRLLPGKSLLQKTGDEINKYKKLLYVIAFLLIAGLISLLIIKTDFSVFNWKQDLLIGGIYVGGFIVLVLLESFLIQTIHESTRKHNPAQLFFTRVIISVGLAQIFAFTTTMFLPTYIWISTLIGSGVLMLALLNIIDSTMNETLASTAIFYALTYFFYTLLTRIYTKEVLLTLIG